MATNDPGTPAQPALKPANEPADERAIVARARDYPYPFPAESFIYSDDGPKPFAVEATAGRIPVLAIGSNQSPIRLGQKFGQSFFAIYFGDPPVSDDMKRDLLEAVAGD